MKKKTMNFILVLVGIAVLIFTALMIWLYILTGAIPDTLCTCFFVACTGEAGIMGWIKTAKVKNIEHEWAVEEKQKQIENIKKALAQQEPRRDELNEY